MHKLETENAQTNHYEETCNFSSLSSEWLVLGLSVLAILSSLSMRQLFVRRTRRALIAQIIKLNLLEKFLRTIILMFNSEEHLLYFLQTFFNKV